MSKTTFAARVTDDLALEFVNPVRFKQHLLALKGQIIEVTAEKQKRHRTSEQNAYYWGVVIKTIADFCGYFTADELDALHQELRRKFLPAAGRLNLPVSTAKLSTVEMNEYIEKIRVWAGRDLGVYVPDPNEVQVH